MIKYKTGGRHHIYNLFTLSGSVLPFAFAVAMPVGLLTILLKVLVEGPVQMQMSSAPGSTAWGGFTSLVGFLIVFRTSQSYGRFCDGCTATHQMRAEWFDAVASIIAFCRFSRAKREVIVPFQELLVRLFSLLHVVAIGEIEEDEDESQPVSWKYELVDILGIDAESLMALEKCPAKVELVFQWIQSLFVENIKNEVLSIPAPLLSRAFQELAGGMVCYHEAMKISQIPIPFPYSQVCDLLLVMHWIASPVVICQQDTSAIWAGTFAFIQVFVLWSMNAIAVEIEQPFGTDANDIDTLDMQKEMNSNLLLLVSNTSTRLPTLSDIAHAVVDADLKTSCLPSCSFSTALEKVKPQGHAIGKVRNCAASSSCCSSMSPSDDDSNNRPAVMDCAPHRNASPRPSIGTTNGGGNTNTSVHVEATMHSSGGGGPGGGGGSDASGSPISRKQGGCPSGNSHSLMFPGDSSSSSRIDELLTTSIANDLLSAVELVLSSEQKEELGKSVFIAGDPGGRSPSRPLMDLIPRHRSKLSDGQRLPLADQVYVEPHRKNMIFLEK